MLESVTSFTIIMFCIPCVWIQWVPCLQEEAARSELHALGFVDGHEGQQSLSVKFYLQASAQEGKAGQNR